MGFGRGVLINRQTGKIVCLIHTMSYDGQIRKLGTTYPVCDLQGVSRRFFTNHYFFQLILGRFSGVFLTSTNSGKPQCRFSRRIRGFWDRLIADPHFGCPKNLHSSRCGILPHSREERHSCRLRHFFQGKRFAFASFRGFVRSRRPATAYGSRRAFFLALKFKKFHFFLSIAPSHPPMARGK